MKYETILKTITDYVLKCSHYPKLDAINLLKNHPEQFQEETWTDKYGGHAELWNEDGILRASNPGTLFTIQDNLQRNIEYSNLQEEMIRRYGLDLFRIFQAFNNNDTLSLNNEYQELSKYGQMRMNLDNGHLELQIYYQGTGVPEWIDLNQCCEELERTIDKSPTLQSNQKAYRYGRLPTGVDGKPLQEGEHGSFKGFTGLTYNEDLVFDDEGYLNNSDWMNSDNRYKLTCYVIEGTKGLVLGESVHHSSLQNELLLNRNQRCMVWSRSDETKEATILIY